MEKGKPEEIIRLEEFYGISLVEENYGKGYVLNENEEIIRLFLRGSKISDLSILSELSSLQQLDVSINKLTEISPLAGLRQLKTLSIDYNLIVDISPLTDLKLLENLRMNSNPISNLAPLLEKDHLSFLAIGDNVVSDYSILEKINGLRDLHIIDENKLDFRSFGKIPQLEYLAIFGVNKLDTSFLKNFLAISSLTISECNISDVQNISRLSSLTQLHLDKNQISHIQGLEQLKLLTEINLSHNQIVDIQPIVKLKNLRQLQLSKNAIKDPSSLGNLKALINLDIDNNNIEFLDDFKFLLKTNNLNLRADNNPCFSDGQIVLEKGENHFDTIKNELLKSKERSNDYRLPVKVLALGNHASGKSTLIEYIQNEGANKKPIEDSKSTHIVKIETYPKTLKKDELPKAIIYDFGGQDYYHGIYRAFLSNDSINLLLWNQQNDKNQLRLDSNDINTRDFSRDYWLHQLHYQYSKNKKEGESEPILMIQSYADIEGASRINYKGDNAFFNIVNEFYISLHKKSISKSKVLQSSLKYLDHSLTELIESKQRTEEKPEWFGPFINYIISATGSEYTTLKDIEKSYLREENKKYLPEDLEQLAKKGLLLYYKDDPDIKDIAWLSPSDTVKHIHDSILSKKIIQESGGIVSEVVFKKLVNDQKLLKLLLNQKVVFHDAPYKNYIIPSYLKLTDDDSKIYELLTYDFIAPTFVMKFEHFIPLGLINQLICFFGKNPDKKYYWRDQLFFTSKEYNCKVLIKLDFNNLEIQVFIIGQNNKKNVPVVAKTIFEEILQLYWDRDIMENDRIITIEGIKGAGKTNLSDLTQFLRSKLSSNKIESPQDLFISVDNKNFVHHRTLENEEKTKSTVPSFGVSSKVETQNGKEVFFRKIDKTSVKQLPSILFSNYTSNPNVNRMKKVFISFSRKDVAYKDELKKHLKILETFEISDNWSCEEITIGQWHSQIQRELEESDLIIYMLSANFLSSRYILEEEVKKGMDLIAADTSKKVLCVIVSEFVGLDSLRSAMEERTISEVQDAVLKLSEFQYLPYGEIRNEVTGNNEKKIIPLKEYKNIEKALAQVTQMVLDFLRK